MFAASAGLSHSDVDCLQFFFSTSLNSRCRPTRGHTWQNAGSELRAHWETRVCFPQESFVLSANRAIKRGNGSSPAPSAVSTKRFKTRGFLPTWGRTKTRRETSIFGASGAQRPYFKKLCSGGLCVNPPHGDQRLKSRARLSFIYVLQHCLCTDLFLSLSFIYFFWFFLLSLELLLASKPNRPHPGRGQRNHFFVALITSEGTLRSPLCGRAAV